MYTYIARCLRVVDGDTIDTEIDLGFGIKTRQRIRLADIDAPERFTHEGKAATKFVEDCLMGRYKGFKVETTKKGSFGRWLGHITVNDGLGDMSFNEIMIKNGHAEKYEGK